MYQQKQELTLIDAVTPVAITSSTDATPVVVTATTHGLVTGDRVLIFGHTTNVAANGIFKVTKLTANTFSIQDEFTGADVAGSGAGAGASGLCMKAPAIALISDSRNAILQVGTSGTATTTMKVAGSMGKSAVSSTTGPRYDFPNIGATISPSNPYSFLQIIDLDTAAAVNGATGIVVAGTDINKSYEININAEKYITVIPVTWSAGAITVKLLLASGM